jgi:hypothetical protein
MDRFHTLDFTDGGLVDSRELVRWLAGSAHKAVSQSGIVRGRWSSHDNVRSHTKSWRASGEGIRFSPREHGQHGSRLTE